MSCYWTNIQVETAEILPRLCHVEFGNNIQGRARLWNTAIKIFSPVLRITSPDHLEETIALIVQIRATITFLFRLKNFLLVTLQNEGWSGPFAIRLLNGGTQLVWLIYRLNKWPFLPRSNLAVNLRPNTAIIPKLSWDTMYSTNNLTFRCDPMLNSLI